MTGFLLDTSVVSRIYRKDVSPSFTRWFDEQGAFGTLYFSVVTVHEIGKDIRLLEHRGASTKARSIRMWLQGLITGYGPNVLPLEPDTALHSGDLEAMAIAAGYAPGTADAMIAGTARQHGLTVITANSKHFQIFGIPVISPEQIEG